MKVQQHRVSGSPITAGRRLSKGRLAASLFSAAAIATSLTGIASASTSHASRPATVKPDLAFFKGQTLNYILGSAPGSVTAIQTTTMEPFLIKYLKLAGMTISYDTGQSATGYDQIANAAPTGLNIGSMGPQVVDADLLQAGQGGITFNWKDLTFLGAARQAPGLIVSCRGSGITSIAQALSGTVPLKWVQPSTGASPLENHMLMTSYPVPHSYLGGFTTASDVQGCLSGAGNISNLPATNWLDAAGDGMIPGITPLMLTGHVPAGGGSQFLNSEVPTLANDAAKHKAATAAGRRANTLFTQVFDGQVPEISFTGPAGIPSKIVAALRNAFQWTLTRPAYQKAEIASLGSQPGFTTAANEKAYWTLCAKQIASITATYTS